MFLHVYQGYLLKETIMGEGFSVVDTSQGKIVYRAKDGTTNSAFKLKEKNGQIQIFAQNVDIMLPKNSATKLAITDDGSFFNAKKSKNVTVIDGAENDGKKYADEIILDGDELRYIAARKTDGKNPLWAKDSGGGDKIYVTNGNNNRVYAKSGNNVFVSGDTKHTVVEAYQGTYVKDASVSTTVEAKASPHTKGKNPSSNIFVEGSEFTMVKTEKGTVVETNNKPIIVTPEGDKLFDEYRKQF